jgi:bacterial/archaeal transporter family protein
MQNYQWLVYALLSALAAAVVGIYAKVGMRDVDVNLATVVRSIVMSILLVAFYSVVGNWSKLSHINRRHLGLIALSGAAGAISWLFYFKALQLKDVSKVAPIDKLSMPFAILLAVLFLKERPSLLNWIGILIIAGGAYLATLPAKA